MAKNIEIKARLYDPGKQRLLVETMADKGPQVIEQEDIFFNTPKGRLKLRILSPQKGELIFYERSDHAGPKTSTYSIVETDRPRKMSDVLAAAYGTRNIVRKTRRLYIIGRTRIHLDTVESSGDFLELEVVLGEMGLGGAVSPVDGLADCLQLATDAGAKKVLIPACSVRDITTIPPELFAKFQTSFYQGPVDTPYNALRVE